MNIAWMRLKLEHFLALCDRYDLIFIRNPWSPDGEMLMQVEEDIADALPTVEQIIRRIDPHLLTETLGRPDPPPEGVQQPAEEIVQSSFRTRKALAVLRDREEWKINLAADSPSLRADEFHPTIWKAAADVWETGEYKMAAQAACISLSAHIKKKAGSPPLNERVLVAQVFSMDEPKPEQAALPRQPRRRKLEIPPTGIASSGARGICWHPQHRRS
jgi:hypothetical protein